MKMENPSRSIVNEISTWKIHFLECGSYEKDKPGFELTFNDKLSVAYINTSLLEKTGRKVRLYNFYGIEINDDSDLEMYNKDRNKVIFFTKSKIR